MPEISSVTEPCTLFMYYKVPIEERAAALAAARALRAQLCITLPEVDCELMQRPEVSKGMETWMEVYRTACGVTKTIEQTIEAVIATIPELGRWPRAREIFVPLRMQ